MSGRRSRSKGDRTERSIVNALLSNGIAAVRVPLSGAAGGRFAGDIVLPLLGRDLCVEVKARADGFRELYCWLNQRDVLIVKADRQEPLVVLRLSLAADIAKRVPDRDPLPSSDAPGRRTTANPTHAARPIGSGADNGNGADQ